MGFFGAGAFSGIFGGSSTPVDITALSDPLKVLLQPTNASSIFTDGAQNFVRASSQNFKSAASTAMTGDADFTVCALFRLSSNPTGTKTIVAKDNVSANRAWSVYVDNLPRVVFENPATFQTAASSSISTATWYLMIAWYDKTAGKINLQLNNGSVVQATSGAFATKTAELTIGSKLNSGSFLDGFQGDIDSVGLWTRVLTSGERAQLYNSGNYMTFADLDTGLKTGLYEWFDLNEPTGGLTGKVASLALTASASRPTFTAGVPQQVATASESVAKLNNTGTLSSNLAQATASARPILTANVRSTNPAFRFDGTDDVLTQTSGNLLTAFKNLQKATVIIACDLKSLPASTKVLFSTLCSGSSKTRFGIEINSSNAWVLKGVGLDADTQGSISGGTASTGWQLITAQINYTTGQGRLRVNRSTVIDWSAIPNMTAGSTSNTDANNVTIAGLSGGSCSNIDLGNVYIWTGDTGLSDGELASAEYQIAQIWGL